MSETNTVFVELGSNGYPIRIFKNRKATRHLPEEMVRELSKKDAVYSIRKQVYDRSRKRTGFPACEECGKCLTWDSGQMHEKHPKGKRDQHGTYGEVSVENCIFLCHGCHQGRPDSAHGDRRWQTAKVAR